MACAIISVMPRETEMTGRAESVIEELNTVTTTEFPLTRRDIINALETLTNEQGMLGIQRLYKAYRDANVRTCPDMPQEEAEFVTQHNLDLAAICVDKIKEEMVLADGTLIYARATQKEEEQGPVTNIYRLTTGFNPNHTSRRE